MEFEICKLNESENTINQAALILLESFPEADTRPDIGRKKALDTVNECTADGNIAAGLKLKSQLIGWAGLRPMYEKTWELHPLAIKPEFQRKGYGRILLNELEKIAQGKGIIGIVAGSDDETNSTSLSEKEITGENIFEEIKNIRNHRNHPFEFYKKCGYSIVGVIPNANGQNKPDIWLWKDIRKNNERGLPAPRQI